MKRSIANILGRLRFSLRRRLPVVMQTEVAECGHACIAMIASYWKYEIDLASLRRRFVTSIRGVTLEDIINIASSLNLVSRPLQLELDELAQLRTPAILHWDLNHFVVLKEVRGRRVIIHDPARGKVSLSIDQVSGHFTGVALELAPGTDFREVRNKECLTLTDMVSFIQGLIPHLLVIFAVSFAIELFSVFPPLAMQFILDEVIPGQDSQLLSLLVIGFFSLSMLLALARYIRSFTTLYLMNTLNIQLCSNIFSHLVRLPLSFFEKRTVGDILSRFRSIDQIQQKITTDFIEGLVDGIMVLVTLVLMFIYSTRLTLIVCASLLLLILIRVAAYRVLRQEMERQQVTIARENSCLIETLRSILPLKVFSREQDRTTLWQALYADRLNSTIRLGRYQLIFNSCAAILAAVENTLVLLIAARSILAREFSAGMLVAYLAYRSQFVTTAQSLINKVIDYRMISVLLDRLFDVVAEPPEQVTYTGPQLPLVDHTLTADRLYYTWPGSEKKLGPLSFTLEPGQMLALNGPSGCGKTTLLKTLMLLLPADSGSICIGGGNIRTSDMGRLRLISAAVMQDDTLLSGSLMDNISFFDRTPDREKVVAAARVAAIHEDIMLMPMAYDSLVGELGSSLSGGQKQRVLLARALYCQPKILFLDEATSHLDESTEWKVLQQLKQLHISLLVITHRQSTLALADQVIELE
ncbi:peptidase domain-containing ABC transporter [Endozoicomonadaceae bacterium StTr2]